MKPFHLSVECQCENIQFLGQGKKYVTLTMQTKLLQCSELVVSSAAIPVFSYQETIVSQMSAINREEMLQQYYTQPTQKPDHT